MIPSQRHLFEIPHDVAYLNCAYMSPLMRKVIEAGEAGLRWKTRPWEITPRDFYTTSESVRSQFAQIINASADDIAIIPAASYGIAVAARNLPISRGQTIVTLQEQFPSNVYAWHEVAKTTGAGIVSVERPCDDDWTDPVLDVITERTAVAALPNCHWTDGRLLDLVQIGVKCRQVGAALSVDITQSAGALPFDVHQVQPDFAVAASYKWLMGPYSTGFLYVSPRWQSGEPLEHNWIARKGSENFAGLVDYDENFQAGACRFDVGERSNFALLPMVEAALLQIVDWGITEIATTLSKTTNEIAERARKIGLTALPEHLRAGHFLGLRFPHGVPVNFVKKLAAKKVFVSVRGDSIRVTPHLYNTCDDIERLFALLEST